MYNINKFDIKKSITLQKNDSFKISETLECGQCFRFEKIDKEKYILIAFKKVILLNENEDGSITIYNTDENEFKKIWKDYFDLNRNYSQMKSLLSEKDDILKKAIEYAPGIRILKQEFFECLISFIISQNNRIPTIKKVIENISEKYGDFICEYNNKKYYSFPTVNQLLKADESGLRECKAGFRAKYIIDAIYKIKNNEINFEQLKNLSYGDIKENLMKINGVGQKVSDCVILFSFNRVESFPVDVWVKRIMFYFYFDNKEVNIEKIHKLADEKFSPYAGFAQQYLFNYARQLQIGK